jgi:hypothetical protein
MKKIASAGLVVISLLISQLALADYADPSLANSAYSVETAQSSENTKRVLWEPHLRIFNDSGALIVVYTANTKMTYYPGDVKDPYYGLQTWGAQYVIMLDKESGDVFYNSRVVDESFLHITAQEIDGKRVYNVATEVMHDQPFSG